MPRDDWDDDAWEEDDDDSVYDEIESQYVQDDELDTLPCPACGAEVYEEAPQCPYCAAYMTPGSGQPSVRPGWQFVALVLLILAGVGAVIAWRGQ